MSKSAKDAPMLADAMGGGRDLFPDHVPYEAVLACPTCALPLRATLDTCPSQRTWHACTVHDGVDGHEAHAPLDMHVHYDVVVRVRDAWITETFVLYSRHERAAAAAEVTVKPSRAEVARRRQEKRDAEAHRRRRQAERDARATAPPSDAPASDA